jgi:hypothetical protein
MPEGNFPSLFRMVRLMPGYVIMNATPCVFVEPIDSVPHWMKNWRTPRKWTSSWGHSDFSHKRKLRKGFWIYILGCLIWFSIPAWKNSVNCVNTWIQTQKTFPSWIADESVKPADNLWFHKVKKYQLCVRRGLIRAIFFPSNHGKASNCIK